MGEKMCVNAASTKPRWKTENRLFSREESGIKEEIRAYLYSLDNILKECVHAYLKQLITHLFKVCHHTSQIPRWVAAQSSTGFALTLPSWSASPGPLPSRPLLLPPGLPSLLLQLLPPSSHRGSASWRNSSLCPPTLLRTVGWQGTSKLPAGNCFCEGFCEVGAFCQVSRPLPCPCPGAPGGIQFLL